MARAGLQDRLARFASRSMPQHMGIPGRNMMFYTVALRACSGAFGRGRLDRQPRFATVDVRLHEEEKEEVRTPAASSCEAARAYWCSAAMRNEVVRSSTQTSAIACTQEPAAHSHTRTYPGKCLLAAHRSALRTRRARASITKSPECLLGCAWLRRQALRCVLRRTRYLRGSVDTRKNTSTRPATCRAMPLR